MIYTLTLNPALDYVIKSDTMSAERINKCYENEIYYGGKGINVSCVLNELGLPNVAWGFISGFTGDELEGMLKDDGINCDFIKLKQGRTRINVKLKCGKEYDFNAESQKINDDELNVLYKKIESLESGDYLVLSGSVPKGMPRNTYELIMEKMEDRGVSFIVDTTGESLMSALKYKPFLIKPNHIELAELFGLESTDNNQIIEYAKELKSRGAVNVLVSMAENGAVLVDEYGIIHQCKNAQGTLINSTGCGDSMLAGFLAGYIEKKDYDFALKLGNACGNATAFSEGLANRLAIEDILKR